LSGGGQQVTLVTNTYDGYGLEDLSNVRDHDAAYGQYFGYRGNVTQRAAGGGKRVGKRGWLYDGICLRVPDG
jgi:hypothetical protein